MVRKEPLGREKAPLIGVGLQTVKKPSQFSRVGDREGSFFVVK